VQFGIAVGIGIEFNDNITLAEHDRISDFILRPSLDIQATWRLSELNTLKLSVGALLCEILDHSEFDSRSVLLSPNSELSFTVYLGQVKFTLRDRLSYQEDNYNVPDPQQYGGPLPRFETKPDFSWSGRSMTRWTLTGGL